MYPSMDLLFILLPICYALWICNFMSFINRGNFSDVLFAWFFYPILCLFLLETISNLDMILSLFLSLFSLKKKKVLFIYFWLCWLFSSRSTRSAHRGGFSRCGAQALGHVGFSSCGRWAQSLQLLGSRAQAQQLWRLGLLALWHVGYFQIRDQICTSCTDRWILHHWVTKEARPLFISISLSF